MQAFQLILIILNRTLHIFCNIATLQFTLYVRYNVCLSFLPKICDLIDCFLLLAADSYDMLNLSLTSSEGGDLGFLLH